ncbi:hypothetical protein CEE44_04005 [Candidatus Woesearchaeota archaeon B3_Woes]|nr:MAG: hypothetical protein CEE44_04005 [Candidatus Woesearchaeota archaeon B3_Woes]
MKKYIALILIIALLILVGCKKSTITPTGTVTLDPLEEEIIEEVEPEETTIEENTTETEPKATIPEGTHIVAMQMAGTSMVFFPKQLTISVGDTIRWENRLDYLNKTAELTVYSYQSLFRGSKLKYGEYFEHTFREKGTFRYNALPYIKIFKPGEIIVR